MIVEQVQVEHYVDGSDRVDGILLQGRSADDWVDQISKWPIDHSLLRCVVIPVSNVDVNPSGLFVFGNVFNNRAAHEFSGDGVLFFHQFCDHFFIPTNARFRHNVLPKEIEALIYSGNHYVWHPSIGLIAVNQDQLFALEDLFEDPVGDHSDWDEAVPGIVFAHSIERIDVLQLMSVDEIIDEGREDIGTGADEIDQLPPTNDEPSRNIVTSMNDAMVGGMAKFVKWFTDRAPSGASQSTWVDRVANWADSKLTKISEKLDSERNKELYRLKKLLEQNPDEGLKYALPIGGDSLHRGIAPPSNRLGSRNVDFKMSSLGGGRATDYWDVPHQIQYDLNRKYRELAEREIRLNRHRRAAYIYANLLGETSSAARALEQGNFWREAAILYRDKLSSIHDAARCFERGGYWSEAIAAYTDLNQHEKVGDIYDQLQQHEKAKSAFQEALSAKVQANDFVDASRVAQEKLNDTELALETLESGWKAGTQQMVCARNSLQIIGELGNSDRALAWVEELKRPNAGRLACDDRTKLLCLIATRYPDQTVNTRAEFASFEVISDSLDDHPARTKASILNCMQQLAPSDRLLTRDCRRFISNQPKRQSQTLTKHKPGKNRIEFVKRHTVLTRHTNWECPIGFDDQFFVFESAPGQVWVFNGTWANERKRSVVFNTDNYEHATCLVAVTAEIRRVILHRLGGRPFDVKSIPVAGENAEKRVQVGHFQGLDSNCLSIVASQGRYIWALRIDDQGLIIATKIEENGTEIASLDLTPFISELSENTSIPSCDNFMCSYFAFGPNVVEINSRNQIDTLEFNAPINRLAASHPHMRFRLAASFDQGFQFYWGGMESKFSGVMSQDFESPHLLLNRAGQLIVASGNNCEVFLTNREKLVSIATGTIGHCLGLCKTDRPNEFAVFDKSGKITVYRVPLTWT